MQNTVSCEIVKTWLKKLNHLQIFGRMVAQVLEVCVLCAAENQLVFIKSFLLKTNAKHHEQN